jgi:hypothetical protein
MRFMGLRAAQMRIACTARLSGFGASLGAAMLTTTLVLCCVSTGRAAAAEQITIATTAGLRESTRVLRVTTLADDGPGSLREALTASGPRIVVFEVSGYVDLASRIDIITPYLTVAGQTAPDTGITIRGSGIALRTHDVRLEHLAIYPGASTSGVDAREIDALALISRSQRQHEVRQVVIRNLTLGHATDENLSLAGDAIGQVRVESSLIAKGLRHAGHPRVSHSMGMLIYPNVRNISVVGNIFSNNDRRNPIINPGIQAVVANNFVFGFGITTINVLRGTSSMNLSTSILENYVMPNEESRCGVDPVQVPPGVYQRAPGAILYLSNNVLDRSLLHDPQCAAAPGLHPFVQGRLVTSPPVVDPDWRLLPASEVRAFVLAHAGMRPGRRPPMDALIIRGIVSGTGRVIDRVENDGGWPDAPGITRRLNIPVSDTPSAAELPRMQAWLCSQHFAVGGIANADCRTP